MAQYTLTSLADEVYAADNVADVVRTSVENLSSEDTISGGNGNVQDRIDFSNAGYIGDDALENVTGIEWVRLSDVGGGVFGAPSEGNYLELTDAFVASAHNGRVRIDGSTLNDIIDGSAVVTGTSTLNVFAGEGHDSVLGGAGADTLRGDAGDDEIYGGNGNDSIIGGTGDDTIGDGYYYYDGPETDAGAAGNDTLMGGEGNDLLVVTHRDVAGDVFNGGTGNDTVGLAFGGEFHMRDITLSSVEAIWIGDEALELTLTAAKRAVDLGWNSGTMVIGAAGHDTFYMHQEGQAALGYGGNDVFVVDADSTEEMVIAGGAGQDAIHFVGGTDCDEIDFDDMVVTGIETIYIDDYSTDIELDGSVYTVHAGNGGNQIDLGWGKTTEVSSGDGTDYIEVNRNTQVVSAGGGNDTVEIYAVLKSTTTLVGGAGSDTLIVHDTDDDIPLTMGAGIRSFETVVLHDDGCDGDEGVEFTTNNTANLTVIGSDDDDLVRLRNATQNVELGSGDDTVVIDMTNNGTLDGGAHRGSEGDGDEVLVTGNASVVFGNVTNFEFVRVQNSANVTLNDGPGDEPEGIDYVVYLDGAGNATYDGASVTGGIGDETYHMNGGYQEVSSGNGTDYINVHGSANYGTVDGGEGNDTIDINMSVNLSTLDIDGGNGDDQVNIFLGVSGDLTDGAPSNFTSIERFQITLDDNGDGHDINAEDFLNLTLLTFDGADSAVGANVSNLSGDLDASDLEGIVMVEVVKDSNASAADATNITVGNGSNIIDATDLAPGDELTIDGGNDSITSALVSIDHSDLDASGYTGLLSLLVGADSNEGVGTDPDPGTIDISTGSGTTIATFLDALDAVSINATATVDDANISLIGTANNIDVTGLQGNLVAIALGLTGNLTVAAVSDDAADTVSVLSNVLTSTQIDAAGMVDDSELIIGGTSAFVVTNLSADVNASAASGNVSITTDDVDNLTVALGVLGSNTIDADAMGDDSVLTLTGGSSSEAATVDLIGADLAAGGFDGNLTVTVGSDTAIGSTDNSIVMGCGSDSVSFDDGLDGGDTVTGGSGNDTLSFTDDGTGTNDLDNVSSIETINLGNAVTNVTTVDALIASGSTLTVNGSSNTFAITFNAAADTAGNLSISTGGGNDVIWATANGSDTVSTGNGTDEIRFGTGLFSTDTINGGAGADTLFFTDNGTNNNDLANVVNVEYIMLGNAATNVTAVNTLVANNGVLTVDGGNVSFVNGILFNGAAETDGKFTFITGAGSDTITGGSGADTFTATAGDNTIFGGGDNLIGGGGNDSFVMGTMLTGADTISGGGGGTDRLDFTDNGQGVTDLDYVTGVEIIKFGDANTNVVLAGDNLISGTLTVQINGLGVTTGNITFDGSAEESGQFDFFGGRGNDSVIGSISMNETGGDTIDGSVGNDTLFGDMGDDSLIGGTGTNVLVGGEGADTIDGLDGAADVFYDGYSDLAYFSYDDGAEEFATYGDVYLLNGSDDNFIFTMSGNISDPTEAVNVTTLTTEFDFDETIAQATTTVDGDFVTGDTINADVIADAADLLLAGGINFFDESTAGTGYVLVGDEAVDGQQDWTLFFVQDGASGTQDGNLTADEVYLVGVFKDYGAGDFDGFFRVGGIA